MNAPSLGIIKSYKRRLVPGDKNSCWNWKYANVEGYGKIGAKNGWRTSRLAWYLKFGNIPHKLFVLHKCDNPSCCNPDHLFLGTNKQNVEDMIAKGRMPRGEKRAFAKLTEKDVKSIRKEYLKGNSSCLKLGGKYCVSPQLIHDIVKRRKWKHIDDKAMAKRI